MDFCNVYLEMVLWQCPITINGYSIFRDTIKRWELKMLSFLKISRFFLQKLDKKGLSSNEANFEDVFFIENTT